MISGRTVLVKVVKAGFLWIFVGAGKTGPWIGHWTFSAYTAAMPAARAGRIRVVIWTMVGSTSRVVCE